MRHNPNNVNIGLLSYPVLMASDILIHRAKYVPKGGPDGGEGGRGGQIILRANPQFWTLIHLKYRKHVKAENGGHGEGGLRTAR